MVQLTLVIVMILTSLNSPEERVFTCGAPWDLREEKKKKLDHEYCVCVCLCVLRVSSHSGWVLIPQGLQ